MRTASLVFCFSLLAVTSSSVSFAAPAADPKQAIAGMEAALRRGNPEAGIDLGEAAVAATANNSELWTWLGRCYCSQADRASILSKAGLAKKCSGAFQKAIELDPKNAEAHYELAGFYYDAPGIVGGSKEKAFAEAGTVVALNPSRGHTLMATLLVKEGKLPAAEAEYRKAVAADPKCVPCAVALGNFYTDHKRHAEAAALWQQRLDADKGDMLAHYQLAKIALLSGSGLDRAVDHLKAYLAAPPAPDRPTWADAHWRLGLVYEKLGRKPAAVAELREALKANPHHADAKKDLERLGG
jgi:tetratricopeptide (TPR) repeat protein